MVAIFVLSSALNYLDRQIVAALAPVLKEEFHLNNEGFGLLLSVFSITYAISSPLMGMMLDRFGLNIGMTFAVGFWSLAGMARGMVSNFTGLLTATAALGIGEAAGIPSTGKVGYAYLEPKERAIGAGLSQIGLSIGSVAAPMMATSIALAYGWRWAFIIAGALGFVWIPLWLWTAKKFPPGAEATAPPSFSKGDMLRDKMVWGFIGGNILAMVIYSLWTNWTTLYLTTEMKLSLVEANRLAPMPHFFAYAGALGGGWLSYFFIHRGAEPLAARRRALLIIAFFMLTTALVPFMPTPLTATLMISVSFFAASAWGVTYYTMPVDAFGPRAAFAVSLLTMGYGIMQIFVSPLIGRTIDLYGFTPVCLAASVTPFATLAIIHLTRRR